MLLLAYSVLGTPAGLWQGLLWLLLACFWLLNVRPLRIALISRPFMRTYRRLLPSMSQTEREALEAGTVWWDGELFTGEPRLAQAAWRAGRRQLSAEEQAFLDGPCESCAACSMTWTSPTGAATCRRRCGSTSNRRASSR